MSYYSAEYVMQKLDMYPQYRDKLYCRGFLITTDKCIDLDRYPFYGNWDVTELVDGIQVYTHCLTSSYFVTKGDVTFFLIGHAYNPYSMEYDEKVILNSLGDALCKDVNTFWQKESELTGVFVIGYADKEGLTISNDCTGMQLAFQGVYNNNLYITSHAKLAADICKLEQSDYVKRLVNSRFYRYWGTWLPADLSPYDEFKKLQPNCFYEYSNGEVGFTRYFPLKRIAQVSEVETEKVLRDISAVLKNSMKLIAQKWPNRVSISVTGGRDSTTTLSSANGHYDQFHYFSYISTENERVDAIAAHSICDYLGLEHKIYEIPSEDDFCPDIEVYRMLLECNAGCIGHNNANDVRKRAFFCEIDDFDVEVKSWVNELGRGEAQNKYGTNRWPAKPTPGYYRCMWKVILNPRLILESNRIFKEYLSKYYSKEDWSYLPWMDYFFWEFSWSGGEGTFLTSEHRLSYDITIPYNNRLLLSKMFSLPLEFRIKDGIPINVIEINNPKVREANITIKNIAHTKLWKLLIRTYLRLFSKV